MGFKCRVLFSIFCQCMLLLLQEAIAGQHYYNVSRLKGRKQVSGCDLFQGRWVVDSSYPLYDSSGCPFIDAEFDCQGYGRPDTQYLKYSWQPDSCNIPRYVLARITPFIHSFHLTEDQEHIQALCLCYFFIIIVSCVGLAVQIFWQGGEGRR